MLDDFMTVSDAATISKWDRNKTKKIVIKPGTYESVY